MKLFGSLDKYLISIGLVLFVVASVAYVYGQEVNNTEEASKNAKEILCKKYYECEVNNSTESNCFTLGNYFEQRSRCILN
jgi:uncharacterized protein (UPF0333 family)